MGAPRLVICLNAPVPRRALVAPAARLGRADQAPRLVAEREVLGALAPRKDRLRRVVEALRAPLVALPEHRVAPIAEVADPAEIADALEKPKEAIELRDRSLRYRAKLETLWSDEAGMFLNKDLHTGALNQRLSPTNFYPLMAQAATPAQAKVMLKKHLLNPQEFWGEWVIPSIARNDPGFKDQNYWRGRIWGPMNYLVYLGLQNYDDAATRREFARKSYNLFLKEWKENGHVHENYNSITGVGDDVRSSDRFYHWGALLGYVEYLEQSGAKKAPASAQ